MPLTLRPYVPNAWVMEALEEVRCADCDASLRGLWPRLLSRVVLLFVTRQVRADMSGTCSTTFANLHGHVAGCADPADSVTADAADVPKRSRTD